MNQFWFGSQESYDVVLRAQASVQLMAKSLSDTGSGMPDLPPTMVKDGSLAIIPVVGSLIEGSAGFLRFFGVTGYADIEDGMTLAALDPDVKSMLLQVESPGGSVNGVQAASDYIASIKRAKPVSAHIGRVGASAGYWIGCAADSISLDPMGITGSIGCIQTHTSYSKMLAAEGIDKTIIRSGQYKMLGNPIEPLSDLGRSEMQSQVDDLAAMFEAHVAKMRGVPVDQVRSEMGQGRTFLGKRALTAGLVDRISSFEAAVAAAKKVDKAKSMPNNRST